MKYVLILSVFIFSSMACFSQEEPVLFGSVSGEINFSSARILSESGTEGGSKLRFAPWFNLQFYGNTDYKNHGYFMGFTVRNIGFIYENGNEKWICRNYALGIPIGFKFGNVKDGRFMYAGYEFEVPINYRERYYRNDSKERVFNVWFSDRVSPFTHAGFIGFNFNSGFNLKFKYYFTEFFNPNFNNSNIDDERDIRFAGTGNKNDANDPANLPAREYLKVNVVYLSLSWNMFRKPYYYTTAAKKEKADAVY